MLQHPEENYTFPSVWFTFSLFGTDDVNEGSGLKMKQILKTSPQTDAKQYTYNFYYIAFMHYNEA